MVSITHNPENAVILVTTINVCLITLCLSMCTCLRMAE